MCKIHLQYSQQRKTKIAFRIWVHFGTIIMIYAQHTCSCEICYDRNGEIIFLNHAKLKLKYVEQVDTVRQEWISVSKAEFMNDDESFELKVPRSTSIPYSNLENKFQNSKWFLCTHELFITSFRIHPTLECEIRSSWFN